MEGVAIPGRSLISMNALYYDANVAYAVGCRLSSGVRPIGLRRMIGIYGYQMTEMCISSIFLGFNANISSI